MDDIVDRLTTVFWILKDSGDVVSKNTVADAIQQIERLQFEYTEYLAFIKMNDIVSQLVPFVHDEMRMPSALISEVVNEIIHLRQKRIDEITSLREKVDDLLMYAEQDACAYELLLQELEDWKRTVRAHEDENAKLRLENARLSSFLHSIGAIIQHE